VTRRGRRTRVGGLVVYLLQEAPAAGTRIGFVVGKSVGSSVVRHQVSRRLRAQMAARIARIPSGTRLVVRALPDTARAASDVLGRDLDRALNKLLPESSRSAL
jgi:ribonuclease P protein component